MKDVFGIGEKLGWLRSKHKFTLERVADELGVPKSTYHDYEQGNAPTPFEVLHKAAVFYKVDPTVFFKGSKFNIDQQHNQVANGYVHEQHNANTVPLEMLEKIMADNKERESTMFEFMKQQAEVMKAMVVGKK